ncbi:MAG: glycosidase [Lentisphaerae bacterium GWF2_57_35]|nr:MAG: glycosidase [Lentisphaerae bacterium GWF2_57_35]
MKTNTTPYRQPLQDEELFTRHSANPILKEEDWPYAVHSVFNPGAVRLTDSGETLLLARVEDRRGLSHLCAARSADGISNWTIDPTPTLLPDRESRPEEFWGLEDPRITWIPEWQQYAVVCTAFSQGGPGVSLKTTSDFKTFDHYGMVMPPEDKDAALFPVRFGGHWAMIHRPALASGQANIWISFSSDLRHWGSHRVILSAREGGWWDARKIGLCTPPIRTEEGWLLLYHGVRTTASGSLYRVGLALLDLEDPVKVLYRGDKWVFGPTESYERVGDVRDVVFPCGTVLDDDGDTLKIYYGGADTCIGLATVSLRQMLAWLKAHDYTGTA